MNTYLRQTQADPTGMTLVELDEALDAVSKLWAQAQHRADLEPSNYDAYLDLQAIETRIAALQARFDARTK
jgi:hypothetical protein